MNGFYDACDEDEELQVPTISDAWFTNSYVNSVNHVSATSIPDDDEMSACSFKTCTELNED